MTAATVQAPPPATRPALASRPVMIHLQHGAVALGLKWYNNATSARAARARARDLRGVAFAYWEHSQQVGVGTDPRYEAKTLVGAAAAAASQAAYNWFGIFDLKKYRAGDFFWIVVVKDGRVVEDLVLDSVDAAEKVLDLQESGTVWDATYGSATFLENPTDQKLELLFRRGDGPFLQKLVVLPKHLEGVRNFDFKRVGIVGGGVVALGVVLWGASSIVDLVNPPPKKPAPSASIVKSAEAAPPPPKQEPPPVVRAEISTPRMMVEIPEAARFLLTCDVAIAQLVDRHAGIPVEMSSCTSASGLWTASVTFSPKSGPTTQSLSSRLPPDALIPDTASGYSSDSIVAYVKSALAHADVKVSDRVARSNDATATLSSTIELSTAAPITQWAPALANTPLRITSVQRRGNVWTIQAMTF